MIRITRNSYLTMEGLKNKWLSTKNSTTRTLDIIITRSLQFFLLTPWHWIMIHSIWITFTWFERKRNTLYFTFTISLFNYLIYFKSSANATLQNIEYEILLQLAGAWVPWPWLFDFQNNYEANKYSRFLVLTKCKARIIAVFMLY